jgi:hypothetical protein
MLTWKENMTMNTLLNLGVLGSWCLKCQRGIEQAR